MHSPSKGYGALKSEKGLASNAGGNSRGQVVDSLVQHEPLEWHTDRGDCTAGASPTFSSLSQPSTVLHYTMPSYVPANEACGTAPQAACLLRSLCGHGRDGRRLESLESSYWAP